ncbi:MAG: phage major tail tube protein [Fusobacteriaceae bacterium]|nr:phage major tail tube protein [Fusobacteriaceae bacterium]
MDIRIPHALSNFKVYNNGTDLVGLMDIDLPKVETNKETISGAGIGGEFEVPLIGLLKAMNCSITSRVLTKSNFKLLNPLGIDLTFMGSIQSSDRATGVLAQVPIKARIKGYPSSLDPGKIEPGKAMGSKNEFSVTYYKVWINGEELLEADVINCIYALEGIDYAAPIRANVGMV